METLHYEDEMHLISKNLVTITKKSQIKVFNYETCEFVKSFDTNNTRARLLKILDNQNLLLIFDGETVIKQLDFDTGNIVNTYNGHREQTFLIQVLTSDTFASCTLTQIKIFNIGTGECLKTFEEDFGVLCDIQLTEYGHLITCSSSRPKLRIWNDNGFVNLSKIETSSQIKRIKVLSNDRLVCFCPNREYNTLKMKISIWDLNTQKCLNSFPIDDEDFMPNRFEFSSFM